MALALIAIGSNLGDRRAQLDAAVARLGQTPDVRVLRKSRWHQTAPVGGPSGQGAFLNGAILLETSLAPEALRQALVQVEEHLGRQRDVRWEARTLDLDLLLYDELIVSTPTLTVPHPRMAFRRFVIEPAAEVGGTMLHPQIGWTVDRLLDHLNTARPYVAITGLPKLGKTALAERLAAEFGGAILDVQGVNLAATESLSAGHHRFNDPADLSTAAKAGRSWPAMERAEAYFRWRTYPLSRVDWPAQQLLISDFWLEQSLAYESLDVGLEELVFMEKLFLTARRHYAAPKLLVLITHSDPGSVAGLAEAGVPDPLALQTALALHARRPGVGPLIEVSALDPRAAWSEVSAAVAAMG